MIPNSCVIRHRRQSFVDGQSRFLATAALFLIGLLGTGCEDKAIGRVCDVQADGGALQAMFNGQALECPSRICLRPSKDNTVAKSVTTTALCSAECSKDSDCDGETRNGNVGSDRRCTSGFVCGVAFEVGPLCCKKLCICKDFINIPTGGLQRPASCDPAKSQGQCSNI